jgi:hypothetical protein
VNAYQELQGSGIRWPDHPPESLYQTLQAAPRWPVPLPRAAILDDLETQMAEFAAENVAVLNEVRRYFVLPANSSVAAFLSGHRTISQMLLEAVVHLRACFGASTVFSLRAPIDESGSQTLYAVAMWSGNVSDVRRALVAFDNAWWMARSGQASGYLAFTYELV